MACTNLKFVEKLTIVQFFSSFSLWPGETKEFGYRARSGSLQLLLTCVRCERIRRAHCVRSERIGWAHPIWAELILLAQGFKISSWLVSGVGVWYQPGALGRLRCLQCSHNFLDMICSSHKVAAPSASLHLCQRWSAVPDICSLANLHHLIIGWTTFRWLGGVLWKYFSSI